MVSSVLVARSLLAQHSTDLILRLDHKADEGQEKFVYEALYGTDPTVEVSYEPTGPEFRITSDAGLSTEEYITTVERVMQHNTVSVYDLNTHEVNVAQVPLAGFPKYIRTGDQTKDDTDYQQRKEKWISEHKDVYERFMAEQRAVTE